MVCIKIAILTNIKQISRSRSCGGRQGNSALSKATVAAISLSVLVVGIRTSVSWIAKKTITRSGRSFVVGLVVVGTHCLGVASTRIQKTDTHKRRGLEPGSRSWTIMILSWVLMSGTMTNTPVSSGSTSATVSKVGTDNQGVFVQRSREAEKLNVAQVFSGKANLSFPGISKHCSDH